MLMLMTDKALGGISRFFTEHRLLFYSFMFRFRYVFILKLASVRALNQRFPRALSRFTFIPGFGRCRSSVYAIPCHDI